MHTRNLTFALLVAFAPIALHAPVALAQAGQAGSDPSINAARARFQEGVDFYDKGQYENARAAFLQAYALRKHPAVLLNLAQSSLRANHTLDAARYFQQYLRDSTGLTAAQRADAEKSLAEARQKLGHIEVTALPGTEISVDSERVGTAPLAEPIDVEPGSHIVKARSDELKVDVASGQRVTARFSAGGAAVTPVVVLPTPPAPPVATAPPVAPPPVEPPPVSNVGSGPVGADKGEPKVRGSAVIVPVAIAGGVAVVGLGLAIGVGVIAKSSAQSSADGVAAEIRSHGGRQGVCSSTAAADVTRFGKACSALADDNSKVDTDALVGNIGIGMAVVGAGFAIAWWFAGPKQPAEKKAATWQMPTLAPILGTRTKGLAISGSF